MSKKQDKKGSTTSESKPGEKQWCFFFGEKGKDDKGLLGGKGANLHEMVKLGLPIPQGFTISTEACIAYQKDKNWPAGLDRQVEALVMKLEAKSGKRFGDATNPLLVSVRSGAKFSMPGMMDTVLNLGLNDVVLPAVAKAGERFAWDSYRRFVTMFGDVVLGIERMKFEHLMDAIKHKKGYKQDTDMQAEDLKLLTAQYKDLVKKETGKDFPQNSREQLRLAINAVFDSWMNPRACTYRMLNRIPDDLGTAVNVQEMVFGNMGDDCATGVCFTRNPSTGEAKALGEYLTNAQGEDVVAGIRTPVELHLMAKDFPEANAQLFQVFDKLEHHYKDMQDIEFTIEKKKLFILQTRNAKRTGAAQVKVAVDLVREGVIDKKTGIMRVEPESLNALLHKQITPAAKAKGKLLAKGLPASPGAAVGRIVFTADQAVADKEKGIKTVLVRLETSPEDITGMAAAQGILTGRGGMTSHAAVVARGMNVCCVAGCSAIQVKEHEREMIVQGKTYKEHDWITLDGSTGEVFEGQLPVEDPKLTGDFRELMTWAHEFRKLDVRANADTPMDAQVARDFGAVGIGLCRTEHMFFNPQRIFAMRQMILADNQPDRIKALNLLLPYQRDDFKGLLSVMDGYPVIIRLLDPPLHEFLPHEEKEQMELAKAIAGGDVTVIKRKVDELKEFNPMLGFRGCRLGIVYPEINEMQVRAIFEAAVDLVKEGKNPMPHIEIPLVGTVKEYMPLKEMTKRLAKETGAEGKVKYEIGTMIEVPRAALRANEFAQEAEFMSFGTNDLTQMTCGFSRDDSASFLKTYVQKKIYARDPFESIDQEGVGRLMRICVSLARGVKPNIDIGICGEHGGEPDSVKFCHRIGMNNVSCSPYRVPIAILAAAQAAIEFGPAPISNPTDILLKSNF